MSPRSARRIAQLEESFAHRLPADYLRFVQEHNGARLALPEVRVAGTSRVLEQFLPIVADPAGDPDGAIDVAVVATRLDAHLARTTDAPGWELVPFAALVGADYLVLDYGAGPQAEPTVSIWHHQTSAEFAADTQPVAASFAEFMRTLP